MPLRHQISYLDMGPESRDKRGHEGKGMLTSNSRKQAWNTTVLKFPVIAPTQWLGIQTAIS